MSAITKEIVIEIVEVDNPEVYATQAATSATAAATSATSAATSATNAAASATAAATSATNAETSATSAASSATAAASSATSAGTQATNAATSATAAATSATNAATSATAAASSATAATANGAAQVALAEAQVALATTQANNAAASYDSFDDRYLGAKSSNPALDNDGNALLTGALYWNTTTPEMRVWNGSAWVNVPFSIPTHGHDWADITGEPATFPPSAHTHPSTDITGLGTAATLNVAASGNASASEVVKGDDTRLGGATMGKAIAMAIVFGG